MLIAVVQQKFVPFFFLDLIIQIDILVGQYHIISAIKMISLEIHYWNLILFGISHFIGIFLLLCQLRLDQSVRIPMKWNEKNVVIDTMSRNETFCQLWWSNRKKRSNK